MTNLCFVQDERNVKLLDLHFEEKKCTTSESKLLCAYRRSILYDEVTRDIITSAVFEVHKTENDTHHTVKAISNRWTPCLVVPHAGLAIKAILFRKGLTLNPQPHETICTTRPGTVSVGAYQNLSNFAHNFWTTQG